jgi:hypothetical protein
VNAARIHIPISGKSEIGGWTARFLPSGAVALRGSLASLLRVTGLALALATTAAMSRSRGLLSPARLARAALASAAAHA